MHNPEIVEELLAEAATRARLDEPADANARAHLDDEAARACRTAEAARAETTALALANAQAVSAALHAQAVAVQNFRALVPIVLNRASTQYSKWQGLFLTTLGKYALDDHILHTGDPPADPGWAHMDCTVRSWMYATISTDLLDDVMTPGTTARRVWLAIEDQFLGNKETRALILDDEFRNFVQGDLSIAEYCRKLKSMADALGDLGEPVQDRTLVLSVLRGLNEKFGYMAALLKRQKPFPSFIEVRNDLLLEEITMTSKPGSTSTALLAATDRASSPAVPSSRNTGTATSSGNGGNGGSRRNCRRRRNDSTSNGPSSGWPSFYNPWTGTIQMWPDPSQSRPPVPGPRPNMPQHPRSLSQQHALLAGPAGAFSLPATPAQPGMPAQPLWLPPPALHQYAPQPALQSPVPHAEAGLPGLTPPVFGQWDQTALANNFNTMTLTPPPTTNWYMDSGASSHMTSNSGPSNQERDHQVQ
ncbi:uncharacterized protein LOC133908060 [Phragmites australis]|uniref:uncharacterized protein LOC133908060 n=1 Tax=Phragmites australis TaxID=29695 RepID=UPI002D794498|nr:uncharacterized protein LOC133908060 [Phragmites australis]